MNYGTANAAAALLLAGCASVEATGSSRPAASYVSAKSPDAATQCLSERLGFLVGGPIIHRESSDTRIAYDTGGYAYLVIKVRPEQNGSHIDVHHRLSYPAKVRQNIESCL